jgi:hypothetical protein
VNKTKPRQSPTKLLTDKNIFNNVTLQWILMNITITIVIIIATEKLFYYLVHTCQACLSVDSLMNFCDMAAVSTSEALSAAAAIPTAISWLQYK